MKKIFLTGVVLILLILLTVDFVNDYRRIQDRKDKLQASAIIPGNGAATAAAIAAGMNTNAQEPIEISADTKTVAHKRIRSRHTAIVPVDESMTVAVNDDIMLHETMPMPEVEAQASKEYLGNKPKPVVTIVKVEKVVKKEHRNTVHFGPEVGITETNLYRTNGVNVMPMTGFHAGFIADIGLGDHIALQPGIRYTHLGAKMEGVVETGTRQIDTRDRIDLHYIQVPLDFVVKFGDWHNCRIIAGAGPYASYLVKATDKYSSTTTMIANPASRTTASSSGAVGSNTSVSTDGQRSIPIGNSSATGNTLNSFDWGVNGFVGVETPGGFYGKAGTEVGLMNIQHNADGTSSNRNYDFFVSVGYLIGFKR